MKTFLLPLILSVFLLGATPSCETYHTIVSPETNVAVSSYTVQTAEHTLRAAKDTFDLFFGLVKDNHSFVVTYLPSVYSFAEKWADPNTGIKPLLIRANAAKNAYKNNRTPDNQTSLNTIMATIAQLMQDAHGYSKQIESKINIH